METGEGASSSPVLRRVLGAQKRRVVTALATDGSIDATPIVHDGEVLSSEEYVTLVYELHHVHLPELAAADVIEFDRREGTVRRGSRFEEIRQSLATGDGRRETVDL